MFARMKELLYAVGNQSFDGKAKIQMTVNKETFEKIHQELLKEMEHNNLTIVDGEERIKDRRMTIKIPTLGTIVLNKK